MDETLNSSGPAEVAAPSPAESIVLPTGPVPTIMEHTSPQAEQKPVEPKQEAKETPAPVETKTGTDELKVPSEPETKTETKPSDDNTRLDKIPRFQELLKESKEAKAAQRESDIARHRAEAKLEATLQRIEALERNHATPQQPQISIDSKSLEALIEEEGTGAALEMVYKKALEDAKSNVLSDVNQRSVTERMERELKSFSEAHTDFMSMFESGELSRIADESPLYNTPVAAYLKVKLENDLKAMRDVHATELADAVAKARKDEQDIAAAKLKQLEENFKAKKSITVVEERPSVPSGRPEPITSGGDVKKALLERHRQRQSQYI